MRKKRRLLTINADLNPLADGGRYPVPGDTHVGAHIHPGDLVELQDRAGHLLNYTGTGTVHYRREGLCTD